MKLGLLKIFHQPYKKTCLLNGYDDIDLPPEHAPEIEAFEQQHSIKKPETMYKRIAVINGDGIGPEVTHQSVRVLNGVRSAFGHDFDFELWTDGRRCDRQDRSAFA
jgi:hypothetical protein